MARLLIVEDNHELASLMVAAAKSRGHGVHVVYTGEDALAALAPDVFDAAIVDLLLPDIRGSEVLLALRAMSVPAVAMSGIYRGDRFAREATQVHGALAFFEKPFELGAMLESLESLCNLAPSKPQVRVDEEDALELEELEPLTDDETSLPPLPLESLADDEDEESTDPDAGLALPFEARGRVWNEEPVAPPPRPALPDWSLAGQLGATSVARLMNAYYQARHEGELKLTQGAVVKIITFEQGRVVGAMSNLANERFGRYCIRRGVMREADYPSVAQLAQEAKIPTGEAMIRLGLLDAERRKVLLEDQAREVVGATLGWTQGSYSFAPRRKPRADRVAFSLFPAELILQGVLKNESLVALRGQVAPGRRLFPTTDAAYALYELKLSDAQALLLAYADGSKTVEDLLTLTDLSEREALAALRAFELLGLVEERREEPRSRRITFGL